MIPSWRFQRIVWLALPIILGMVSQNVLNVVDQYMVGFLGNEALSAVGVGGILNFAATAFILALGAGVQAISARRVGEGRLSETALPLNGGLLLALVASLPWSAVLWWLVPWFYPFVNDDPGVIAEGVPYLRLRLLAMAAMGMNFCFRGFWNATDRSWLYMGTLLFMHTTNIVLNWVFIYGNLGAPALGTSGAALASAVSTWLGTATYFVLGVRHARGSGFLRGLPSWETLRGILRLSIPNSIQQVFFAVGLSCFYYIVGLIGTPELAASSVIVNLYLVGVLPGMGFGLAGMSLVGQALGRKDATEARQWGWDVTKVGFVVVLAVSLPGMLAPDAILSGFLHDPDTLAIAGLPLRIVATALAFDACGNVLMHGLLGAGDNRRVMFLSIGYQWGIFLPSAFVAGVMLEGGLVAVWIANVAYRLLFMVTMAALWKGDGWTRIKV